MKHKLLYIFFIFISAKIYSQNVITPILTPPGQPAAWNNAANWDGSSIADLISEDADFSGSNVGEVEVPNGYSVTVGHVDLLGGNTFTIASGGTMNIGSSGSGNERDLTTDNATVINVDGDLTVWGNLIVNNNLTLNVPGTLTIKGNLDIQDFSLIEIYGNITIDGHINCGNYFDIFVDTGASLNVGGICTDSLSNFCLDGPLPVELLNFQAKSLQDQVLLTWSTASESNNDFFTVEKSKNGIDFVEIGTVTGKGTINITSNYSFTDYSPYLSLSYYRLSQTDYDGTIEVFPIISVVFNNKVASFSISPNPVSNPSLKLKVSGKAKYEFLELNIIDLQGKLVEQKYFKTDDYGNVETEFQLKKQLQKGTYIIELVSEHAKEYIKVVGK